MRTFIWVLVFLIFVNDGGALYAAQMFAPFTFVEEYLFAALPAIKVRPIDLAFLVATFVASRRGARVPPMRTVLLVAAGTTAVWLGIGLLRGGDGRYAGFQVYLMFATIVAAFGIAATHPRGTHFRSLGKVIVAAALFRALMCVVFYLFYVRNSGQEVPQHMTDHDDTVLWVVAVIILIVAFVENRTRATRLGLFLGVPFVLVAIQLNNRRLAWVSLAGSLLVVYLLQPPSAAKRRLQRMTLMAAPVLALYVAIGWGRSEKIFKPVASLSSVSSAEDASSKARNVENLGLIATASYSSRTGTGWGHRYVELSNKYSISESSELWPYIPHNSILGLLAYTGFLGLIGYWLMFPTAVYLHARTARLSKDPLLRSVAVVGVAGILICLNQYFGDMGIFSKRTTYMLAACFAAAMRVPLEAGAWPAAARALGATSPSTATAVGQSADESPPAA